MKEITAAQYKIANTSITLMLNLEETINQLLLNTEERAATSRIILLFKISTIVVSEQEKINNHKKELTVKLKIIIGALFCHVIRTVDLK